MPSVFADVAVICFTITMLRKVGRGFAKLKKNRTGLWKNKFIKKITNSDYVLYVVQ